MFDGCECAEGSLSAFAANGCLQSRRRQPGGADWDKPQTRRSSTLFRGTLKEQTRGGGRGGRPPPRTREKARGGGRVKEQRNPPPLPRGAPPGHGRPPASRGGVFRLGRGGPHRRLPWNRPGPWALITDVKATGRSRAATASERSRPSMAPTVGLLTTRGRQD